MAEEIVQRWENVMELLMELILPESAKDLRKVQELVLGVREDPTAVTDGQAMRFRLVDRQGRVVDFPLKLISDTTFGQTSDKVP